MNAQKRKKKQKDVPSLEEIFPKRFKSDKTPLKHKKNQDSQAHSKAKSQIPFSGTKNDTHDIKNGVTSPDVEEINESDAPPEFEVTKASLFDDDDDDDDDEEEEEFDEFHGLDENFDMYNAEGNKLTSRSEDNDEENNSFLDDSDHEDRTGRMFSDDSSDEEELNAANMEAISAKLDSFAREDILAAQDELLNPGKVVPEGVLGSSEGNEELSSIKTRIMEIVKVLEDFKNLREPGMKRKDYMEKLVEDVSKYYGYNTYLAQKFLEMFGVSEVLTSQLSH